MCDQKCEHNYEVLDIVYSMKDNGYRTYLYKRVITYFCSKCLDEQTKVRSENLSDRPDWFKG